MTKKYTKAITIGEIIFPNSSPNFIQILLKPISSMHAILKSCNSSMLETNLVSH